MIQGEIRLRRLDHVQQHNPPPLKNLYVCDAKTPDNINIPLNRDADIFLILY